MPTPQDGQADGIRKTTAKIKNMQMHWLLAVIGKLSWQ